MPVREKGDIRVRRILVGEWRPLRELRLRALKVDPLAFCSTFAREERFAEELWQERTESGALSVTTSQWVAEGADGAFLGTATIAEADGEVQLFGMWVDPTARGRGVGRRLLDVALLWTEEAFPGRAVHLEVNRGQAAAVRLYESRGFRFTGTSRPIGHTEGVEVQEMVRPSRTGGAPPAADGTRAASEP